MLLCIIRVKMRRFLCIIILVLMPAVNLRAQSDRFFVNHYEYREDMSDEWGELLLLPDRHDLDYDYPADNVPLDAGLLMMIGMSMTYAKVRKRKR